MMIEIETVKGLGGHQNPVENVNIQSVLPSVESEIPKY